MAAVTLSFAVPLGPGGMGAFEASSVLALAVFDVPLEPAIAFAVIAHLFPARDWCCRSRRWRC